MTKKILMIMTVALMGLTAQAQLSDTVNVGATVGAGSGSFVTVEPSSIGFGTVNPSPTVHRFKSTILTCEYYAANAPWSIEVSTANVEDRVGLVADLGGGSYHNMPMKFWQANFGGGTDPDPNSDSLWTGASPVFKWIFDDGTTPAMTLASSASQDASPVAFQFAIDAEGAYKTNYASTVTFELVIE